MRQHTTDMAVTLVTAVNQALSTPSPSPQSPAFAIQQAFAVTRHPFGMESLGQWIVRFALMDGHEYERSLGWDIGDNCWSDTPDMRVSAEQILLELLEWVEQGWSLSGTAASRNGALTNTGSPA